jgi:hypothetical protein
MFSYTDPMRLMQGWCEAATALTRANMATCEAVGSHMAALWTSAMPQAQARPAAWLDQWSVMAPSRPHPFAPFLPGAFLPSPGPVGMPFNPWMTAWGFPGSPFAALLAGMAETMSRSAVAVADARVAEPRSRGRDEREVSVFDAAYRGAGGYAVAPSIKFSAEVPVSTLAALASVWAWPWPAARA